MPNRLASTTTLRSFGRFVGQTRKLRRVRQFFLRDARRGDKLGRFAIAERDRAGLIEQQHVDVAGRFHRPDRSWPGRFF